MIYKLTCIYMFVCIYTLKKLYLHFLSNLMGYDLGDSFPFDFEPNGFPFDSKLREKLSLRSYPIQFERKWKYSFLRVCVYLFICIITRISAWAIRAASTYNVRLLGSRFPWMETSHQSTRLLGHQVVTRVSKWHVQCVTVTQCDVVTTHNVCRDDAVWCGENVCHGNMRVKVTQCVVVAHCDSQLE